jgi:predicted transglutaminase-like cysteine proteinase
MGRLKMNTLKRLALCLAVMATALPAHAYNKQKTGNLTVSANIHAPEFGVTLPPIGYVQFCARYKAECRNVGNDKTQAELNNKTWAQLVEVNDFVNNKITPVTDMDLYGTVERWDYPSLAGDCEDYVLMKKRYLEGLGFAPEALLITVVFDENGDGHAVLMVRTDGGDFVLDNRRRTVLRWSETGYEYLKRQSQTNPRIWVSMSTRFAKHKNTIAGAN